MDERNNVTKNITTVARVAEIAALIGMLIITAVFFYSIYFLIADSVLTDTQIVDEFLAQGTQASFTTTQRLVGATLMLLSDFLGLFGLFTARKLLIGYQRGEVFTVLAATRLKIIGWVVVLLAPISQISETVGIFYFTKIVNPGHTRLSLSLEDTDVYAMVFGLLIVVIGYVMYEAVRISEEHKSFV